MDIALSIERFLVPQQNSYMTALNEVRRGRKENHWIWYIFPQLRGLGQSTTSWYYGIEDLAEAKAYLEHPVLGTRLREITGYLLTLPEKDPVKIFGWTDSMKLHSCMTLFAQLDEEGLFSEVLEQYYAGKPDTLTLELLSKRTSRV